MVGADLALPVFVGALVARVDGQSFRQRDAGVLGVGVKRGSRAGDRDEAERVGAGRGCRDLVEFAQHHAIATLLLSFFEREPDDTDAEHRVALVALAPLLDPRQQIEPARPMLTHFVGGLAQREPATASEPEGHRHS